MDTVELFNKVKQCNDEQLSCLFMMTFGFIENAYKGKRLVEPEDILRLTETYLDNPKRKTIYDQNN